MFKRCMPQERCQWRNTFLVFVVLLNRLDVELVRAGITDGD
jgi:hypothetical protein